MVSVLTSGQSGSIGKPKTEFLLHATGETAARFMRSFYLDSTNIHIREPSLSSPVEISKRTIDDKAYPFDYGTATCCAGGLTAGFPDSAGIRAAAARRSVRSRKDRDSGGLGVGASGRGGVRARVRGRQAPGSVRSRYVAGGRPRPRPRSLSKEVRRRRRRFHRKTNSSR